MGTTKDKETQDASDQKPDGWRWSTSDKAARANLIANKLNRLQREHEGREHMSPKQETLEALALEIERARDKFPSNRHLFLALVEEVGELSKDLLEGNPGWREEALQVACVALRLYEEGDPTTPRGKQGGVINRYNPDHALPPGETLKEHLEHTGMSPEDLAGATGRTSTHIRLLLEGDVRLDADMALQLERVLKVPASLWLNLESRYRRIMHGEEE